VGLLYRISIQLNIPQAPQIQLQAYIAIAILSITTALIFKKTIPKQTAGITQQKETVIDILAASTTAIFAFCAAFLTQDPTQINVHSVNATAVRLITTWTIIVTLVMVGYRIYKQHSIPI
jgi:hypothetical protein